MVEDPRGSTNSVYSFTLPFLSRASSTKSTPLPWGRRPCGNHPRDPNCSYSLTGEMEQKKGTGTVFRPPPLASKAASSGAQSAPSIGHAPTPTSGLSGCITVNSTAFADRARPPSSLPRISRQGDEDVTHGRLPYFLRSSSNPGWSTSGSHLGWSSRRGIVTNDGIDSSSSSRPMAASG